MTNYSIEGAWWGETFPGGAWMAFTPFRGIETWKKPLGVPPKQEWGIQFPRFYPSPLQVVGQAHDRDGTTPFYHEAVGWGIIPKETFGVEGAIFDAAGTVQINTGQVSGQGWRYVEPGTGRLVTGDETIFIDTPQGRLHEYTQLSNGWLIGQGHDGGLLLWDGTDFHSIVAPPASCRFIRVHEQAPFVALAYTTLAGVEFLWATFAELGAFPVLAAPAPIPQPQPPPIPQPPPSPMPTNIPDPVAVEAALQKARAAYPSVEDIKAGRAAPLTNNQMGAILAEVASHFAGMGGHRKDGDKAASLPGINVTFSRDILRFLPDGDNYGWWTDALGASGVGYAIPLRPEWKRSTDDRNSFVAFPSVASPPTPAPVPPPVPTPPPSDDKLEKLALKVSALEAIVQTLLKHSAEDGAEIARLTIDIAALRAQVNSLPSPSAPPAYRIEGSGYVGRTVAPFLTLVPVEPKR